MNCQVHGEHEHKHGAQCGHKQIEHEGHMDYLHDGHLHHVHEGHVDEHKLGAQNQTSCTPGHKCSAHNGEHQHGKQCGHDAVPHGDHMDYLVEGHLHHPCGTHCDDHGSVKLGG